MPAATAVTRKTYYSTCPGLGITINPGTLQNLNGVLRRVGEKAIQFAPMGNGFKRVNESTGRQEVIYYGQLTSDDPEVIEYLDRRAEEIGDIMTPQRFLEVTTPAEVQMAAMKRELARQNSLIETLQKQGKIPANAR